MGFDITGLGSVFDFGSKIIDKVWPNKDEADKAKLAMLQLQQEGAFKELELQVEANKGQMEVNKAEAASSSLFIGGWRPACGWMCVMGLGYMTLFRPIAAWIATLSGATSVPPVVDTTVLLELLLGMLGMGGLRSYEKIKGVATN